MNNALKNTRIEFHILQSFPVTCLNRDDVGAPKTAVVGGVTRARVSSQCWKRQVRLALQEFGVKLGIRTKKVAELVTEHCIKRGAAQEPAQLCASKIAELLADDTLLFISDSEAEAFAGYAKEQQFDASKIKDKELAKLAKKSLNPALDALDIALFGRMVAKAADMNVEAAASFSHAISTHKVANEVEFFTALDDRQEEPGSAHMGSLEFNSATYYRYISLDLGQLADTMGGDELNKEQLKQAIAAFTKALFVAVPAARQTTQSGSSPWEFAKVLVRKGQRLQVPFDEPVKAAGHGFLLPSVEALKGYICKKEALTGSLFGKLGDYEWGEDETFSLDHLIAKLQSHVE
ncbi:type I-E CRISPR-associated protein Cas7/Cse4/CasC [Aeromonas hydrophila]|uniref:type I-E CRISPR-associated protein Cas7/Cse4/CasC n=1 Tax=Aeromonas hydrophila TaxID=644 RepID=UPI001C5B2600|nr:type I-E CRISPR-associated protein Cas7/Cse4/CasC [Aeromonas hydrophila]MBW3798303.1 type I-E CRISPR-associated protein Cas7/Cse4/CasC [Aeromonas hydrophila]MBW3799661.1 type I-E CRISPR-associated protein Cas7/Cse4/CasC [Aeromonas hydrophila]MBW3821024.1 type I-E CRISPR-associated protein Cas7/Cse4/CasC [Aeromonas hydrophila]MCP3287139.1 type I-E CRISPR-associated protein Cas7/Cse4/CasC [Aeromonas hydrophila]MCX4041906.1 type I-E CRISPR-associated protein Cas7/Cse4/CasC [Aeromonas hydrophil